MRLQEYLDKTREIAKEEKDILDTLAQKQNWNKIETRAAKSSLQTLIENAIGKAKKILKEYECPIVPTRSKDAVIFLYEVGYIDEKMYRELMSAIGFRNAMIHDYMEFDEKILQKVVKEQKYTTIYRFLIADIKVSQTIQTRIKNFTL